MKISASLYSTQYRDLPSLVHELDELKIDCFHLDCFDKDVSNIEKTLHTVRRISKRPIDLHAITSNAEPFWSLVKEYQIEQVTFQYETLKQSFVRRTDIPCEVGMAITSNTSPECLLPIQDQFDFLLLMTTEPGKSGGTFNKTNFKRVRNSRKLFPGKSIHVDGGVNAEVSFILRHLGVDTSVSGSFLVNHINPGLAIQDLRSNEIGSSFQVKDFMIDRSDLPILSVNDIRFKQVLQKIEEYNLGFLFVENNGKLHGISSNGDIRKAMVNNFEDLYNLNVDELINTNPVCILETATIKEMLDLIKQQSFPVLFLPVVDEHQNIKGALTFNQLIRGEA